MRSTITLLAIAGYVSTALANLESRASAGPEVFLVDFTKENGPNHLSAEASRRRAVKRSLKKRAEPFVQKLENDQLLYHAQVSLGTPPQQVKLQIDSGSSDVWVEDSNSRFCQRGQCTEGSFDSSNSNSFKVVNQGGFNISYVDGSSASGDYFTDNFNIGGKTVKNLQMGIARKTNINEGIMGIGFASNEAILQYDPNGGYPSLIDQLVNQNFINTRAYSLWLNDLDSSTGSILFGGIDTEKYQGSLYGLPLQSEPKGSTPTEFAVALSGLSFTDDNGKNVDLDPGETVLPIAAVMDSGSSFTVLPNKLADAAANVLGGQLNQDLGTYLVDCGASYDDKFSFDFTFGKKVGGMKIRVALNELVHPAVDNDGNELKDNFGNTVCQFGIVPSGSLKTESYLFGDTFLRSAYVVYNLDEYMLYIAPTVFNTTKSNVLAINKNGVPDVKGTATDVSAIPSGTGFVHGGYPTGTKKNAASHSQHVGLSVVAFFALFASYLLL